MLPKDLLVDLEKGTHRIKEVIALALSPAQPDNRMTALEVFMQQNQLAQENRQIEQRTLEMYRQSLRYGTLGQQSNRTWGLPW